MPTKPPTTVARYLASLPKDRRDAIEAIRKVIRANLDPGFEECIQYGMIAWVVPHSVYPPGYHCDPSQPLPYMSLASQKAYMSLYLFCVYTSEEEQRRFREAWTKTGKRLDMGKSCVRFKKLEDVPLALIGRTVKRMTCRKVIAQYEAARGDAGGSHRAKKKVKKKTTAKKKKRTTTARR